MLEPHVTEIPLVPPPPPGALRVGAAGTRPEPAAPPPTDSEFGEHGTTTSDTDEVW